jgi:hypothetical protein
VTRAERAVFLETSDRANVELYERLGLSVTGEIEVPGGGPHVWAMMRRTGPVG